MKVGPGANTIRCLLFLLMLGGTIQQAAAFSLLGPYAPWMQIRTGYRLPGDVGGPMNLGEEYRWNLPVITYGFDQSFVSYFGTNGVAAVEQAIAMLNDLPPASVLDPDQFALDARRSNLAAQNAVLMDLKSAALAVLLEQIGLTTSDRYVWTIREINVLGTPPATNYTVVRLNFDPVTAMTSLSVNGIGYTYQLTDPVAVIDGIAQADAVETPFDLAGVPGVAGHLPLTGVYYGGLTRDDTGGIRYLLSRDNINAETLPTGITAIGQNPGAYVNAALRPGVEKITFVRTSYDSLLEMTPPFTNVFTDIFYSNGIPTPQTLQRIITKPDIIFSASDFDANPSGFSDAVRRDLDHWENHAALNGNPGGAGPGVIKPGARIVFNKSGRMWINRPPFFTDEYNGYLDFRWGSWGFSQNVPSPYPAGTPLPMNKTALLKVEADGTANELQWRLWGIPEETYRFQYSSNLVDWTTITNLYNQTGLLEFRHRAPTSAGSLFYRAIIPAP